MENKDLERAIYIWFDMKYGLYSRLEHEGSVYWYYEGQEYADIIIEKKYRNIYFNWDFWKEFSEVFPMELSEFKEVISNWVEDTFNLKGFTPKGVGYWGKDMLKIPK